MRSASIVYDLKVENWFGIAFEAARRHKIGLRVISDTPPTHKLTSCRAKISRVSALLPLISRLGKLCDTLTPCPESQMHRSTTGLAVATATFSLRCIV